MAHLGEQNSNIGAVEAKDTGTEICHIKTQDVLCTLNTDNSFNDSNVSGLDRIASQIILSNSECSSSPKTQGISSFQLVSTYSSSGEANTSSLIYRDSRMHNAPFGLHSQRTDNSTSRKSRWKKSPSLSHKDNSSESVVKKLKSSSGLKKMKRSLIDVDANFNAHELALEMGFEKPNETITIRSSGVDKEDEITKQISPVDIIQQVVDYRNSSKCFCLTDLSIRDIASHRIEISLLDRHSRDFFIMGLLRCGAVTIKETCRNNNRIRNRFNYRLMNTRICHCCFLAVNNIGGKYLKNLKKHFADRGVTSRSHGNRGRKPYHAISSSDITDVVEFVNGYATSYGLPAVKRPKNAKTKHIIRLPPQDNVTSVHKKYKEINDQSGKRAIALTSFRKIWSRHLPHIKLTVKELAPPVKSLLNSTDLHDPVPDIESRTNHPTLQQMLKAEMNSQDKDAKTQASDTQFVTSQETSVCSSHEYSSKEMTRNQMMSMSMYLNDGDNHDALQYGYIFSQNYMPIAHRIQTFTSSSSSPSIPMSIKASSSHASPNNVQHSPFPATVNSSPNNVQHSPFPATVNSSPNNVQHSPFPATVNSSPNNVQHSPFPATVNSSPNNVQHSSFPLTVNSSTNNIQHSPFPLTVNSSSSSGQHSPFPLTVNSSSSSCQHSPFPVTVNSSPSNSQHSPFPMTVNSSPKHTVLPDTSSSNADRHLLLLNSNSSLNTNTSYSSPAFAHTNFVSSADPDHQQISSHIGSRLTSLSQQIHLSLMQ